MIHTVSEYVSPFYDELWAQFVSFKVPQDRGFNTFASKASLDIEMSKEGSEGKLFVVAAFADWCGPYIRISPKIEDWSTSDFKDTVCFLKFDVDKAEELSKGLEIEAMPTFLFYKDRKVLDRFVGANEEQLKIDIEKYK